ncbi:hypothetical protein HAHE_11830 [Haloferula helveola]|uniref:PEP-CTERM protein-sorting domain-containing protein n=1 Tax=Haloferula helveola TaxID=490095 RepID=A0ABM7RJT7_9BACT|nr:hypothetical protein HAHE_11830 [Haloferula helveola]
MRTFHALLASVLATGGLGAAVVVTDNASVTPTIGLNDTGYTGATANRFGWDAGESLTQSFTVPSAGFIDAIYIAYNGFDDGETLTLDLSVNGNLIASGILLDGNNFSGDSGSDGNASPKYWMKFDLSTESVPVTAGSNNFSMTATADTGTSWAFAPMYSLNNDVYAGGTLSGSLFPGGNDDLGFAVTVVPEPASAVLVALAGLTLLCRRRQ